MSIPSTLVLFGPSCVLSGDRAEERVVTTVFDAAFDQERSRLFGLAYRMLGSATDAEDTVQDAYLRWHTADRDEIRHPSAWLTTTVTRLCLNRLDSAWA